ncbi:MAG: DUF3619 family protein [Gammaproteobacteria bacterium]|nr:DUF3619 family protein [Gammaproteobacteria bacterium]
MTNNDDKRSESDFEARLQHALESSTNDIDPEIVERLASMRRSAVAQIDQRQTSRLRGWVPVYAAAFATVVVAFGVFLFRGDGLVEMMPAADEPEIAAAQNVELLTELEFLAWLEETATDAG